MRQHFLSLIFGLMIMLTLSPTLWGQSRVSWISLQTAGDHYLGIEIEEFTHYADEIKELDGQMIQVTGYMIPLDIEGTEYALSAYPNASCFFCGAASPATVMILTFRDSRYHFALDQYVTLAGVFRINLQPDGMLYNLEAVSPVKNP